MKVRALSEFVTWTALLIFVIGAAFFVLLNYEAGVRSRVIGSGSDIVAGAKLAHTRIDGTEISLTSRVAVPFAVMIDNYPDSRPQHGLSEAQVVYEMLVEDGVTRYLALFQNAQAVQIGPVRSARDYFLPYVQEFGADFVHVGGSPQALSDIISLKIADIDEMGFLGSEYFWRNGGVPAPHSVFTSVSHLEKARGFLGRSGRLYTIPGWAFSEGAGEAELVLGKKVVRRDLALLLEPFSDGVGVDGTQDGEDEEVIRDKMNGGLGVAPALSIDIDWSLGDEYDVSYTYNGLLGTYERFIAGEAHVDALTRKQIGVQTVIVMMVPEEEILDDVGRIRLNVLGAGDALVFCGGEVRRGMWRKDSPDARTMFFGMNGEELVFTPGPVWISVVPGDREVSY